MITQLKVFQNGDDALLVWNVAAAIPACRGFAIERELRRDGQVTRQFIDNYVGFAGQPHADGEHRPSTQWPFQGFSWTDHEIDRGDEARYRVVPMVREPDGALKQDDELASEWASQDANAGTPAAPRRRAVFNRGFVMSQFMAHYLKETGQTLAQFKAQVSDADDHRIRRFLSGDLRDELLALLDSVRDDGGELYAALFELGDAELIGRLVALGPRAHLVLSNGSITKGEDETSAQARVRDENEKARTRLLTAGVDVGESDRFISPKPLGHNKFLVATDAQGVAKRVWTGSTNWTPTGLCTQLNNGLLLEDPDVADVYLQQWKLLRECGSDFPAKLATNNSQPKVVGDTTVWFSRTTGVDLDALREEVSKAKQAILFLMFMPGGTGVLADVLRREAEPDLYVRGVVSQLPKGEDDPSVVDVTLVGHGKPGPHRLDVIQPDGRAKAFAYWAAEVTRKQFLHDVGYAIIHSKVLVIDPFSAAPTVVTGSHNFSKSASDKNDENFVIVRNDRALAEAYLINIVGAWRHYRARVNRGKPWEGSQDGDAWMAGSLAARAEEAPFWGF